MSRSLLAISIGPVQDFIAAARRTADLQAGSSLLCDAARAAARAVEEVGGVLAFPAGTQTRGSNRILAEVPSSVAEAAARATRQAVADEVCGRWTRLKSHLPKGALDEELAEAQIAQFPEVFAAWVPLEADYTDARLRVERLLAGRKALRDFSPPRSRDRLSKSPLDPSRDCVLRLDEKHRVPAACRRYPLWLKPRETLDALSLLKRLLGAFELRDKLGVPSTSLMAVRDLLPEAGAATPEALAALEALARGARSGVDLGDLFFEGRLDEEDAEGLDLEQVRRLRRQVLGAVGRSEAPAYYAVLAADGDRMGRIVGAQGSLDAHRTLSTALSTFAEEAGRAVRAHAGHLVYSGGDDVLALLPLRQAIPCAEALAARFREHLRPWAGAETGTLSVGVAVVHHSEALQTAVEWARRAEAAAKEDRNALAVALHTRGGSPLLAVRSWGDGAAEEWRSLVEAFSGSVSRGLPYELLELARELRPSELSARRVRGEAERVIARKHGGSGFPLPASVGSAAELEQFAVRAAIARFLAAGGAA